MCKCKVSFLAQGRLTGGDVVRTVCTGMDAAWKSGWRPLGRAVLPVTVAGMVLPGMPALPGVPSAPAQILSNRSHSKKELMGLKAL